MTDNRPHLEPGPDHLITIEPGNDHVCVMAGGAVIAATVQPLILREADYPPVFYIPRDQADMARFERSSHTTWCPYKGEASYYTLSTDAGPVENAAWSYRSPLPAVYPIKDAVAFYEDKVTVKAVPLAHPPGEATAVLKFWFDELAPKMRFTADPKVDEEIEHRFGALHRAAGRGMHDDWLETPGGALALIVVLDQFSRNLGRGTAAAFAHDGKALALARQAVASGHDLTYTENHRAFFYMPYMHAEDLQAQDDCVHLFTTRLPGSNYIQYAEKHRDIIRRFGRYPHRNRLLGREMTPEEQKYLEEGGETFS